LRRLEESSYREEWWVQEPQLKRFVRILFDFIRVESADNFVGLRGVDDAPEIGLRRYSNIVKLKSQNKTWI